MHQMLLNLILSYSVACKFFLLSFLATKFYTFYFIKNNTRIYDNNLFLNGCKFNDNEVNYITMIQRTIYLLFTTTYQCYTKCTTSLFFSRVLFFI